MPSSTDPPAPTLEAPRTPYDFIEAWGGNNIRGNNVVPLPGTLTEAARALHAVQEFLIDPIAKALKQVSAAVAEANSSPETIGSYPLPEAQRPVTYADIGRLIAFTDELRLDVGYLLDPIKEIVLLAHEDLHSIAAGYTPDDVLGDPSWRAQMTRFHGLDDAR